MQMLVIPAQAGIQSLLTKVALPIRKFKPAGRFSKNRPAPQMVIIFLIPYTTSVIWLTSFGMGSAYTSVIPDPIKAFEDLDKHTRHAQHAAATHRDHHLDPRRDQVMAARLKYFL